MAAEEVTFLSFDHDKWMDSTAVVTHLKDRFAPVIEWKKNKGGKGILDIDSDLLLALYCRDNTMTVAVGPAGIPRDAVFVAHVLPGEFGFEPKDKATVRVLFTSESIPTGHVDYHKPAFDLL